MSHRIIFKKNLILTFTKQELVPFYFFLLLTFGVYLDLGTFWDGGAKLELNSSQINVFFPQKTWRIWLINPDIFLKSEPSWGAYPHTALVLFVLLFKLVSPAVFFVIRHDQIKWFRVNITWNVAMWDFQIDRYHRCTCWWPCTFGDKGKLRGQVYWKSFESQLMCLNRPLRNNSQWSIITVWSCMQPWLRWLEGVIMASGEVGVSGTAVPGAT